MIQEHLRIHKILDMQKWKRLQESLATVTNLAILTVDYKGNPVTSHSGCRPFCQQVRKDPNLLRFCLKCDSRGGLESVRSNSPYVYLCHFNIIDIAIPISVDDKYIGAVMAGQVRLSDPENARELEQILSLQDSELYRIKRAELGHLYDELPVMSYEEVVKVSNMLFLLCNYIVEEALNKNLLIEMFEKASGQGETLNISTILPGYSIKNIESIKKEMTNAIADAYLKMRIPNPMFVRTRRSSPLSPTSTATKASRSRLSKWRSYATSVQVISADCSPKRQARISRLIWPD
ncbi:hypothetical protein HMSSN036_85780 [Paenibacillus macerans]|nr:hypothetical protein HMSSN036_85780 [Paenibacillus macerans]